MKASRSFVFLTFFIKRESKIVKTISNHTKSINLIYTTLKIVISWHKPFKQWNLLVNWIIHRLEPVDVWPRLVDLPVAISVMQLASFRNISKNLLLLYIRKKKHYFISSSNILVSTPVVDADKPRGGVRQVDGRRNRLGGVPARLGFPLLQQIPPRVQLKNLSWLHNDLA